MFVLNRDHTVTLVQGDSADIKYSITGYILEPGDRIDYTVCWQTTHLIEKTITTFEADGDFVVTINHDDTKDMADITYHYSIKLTTKDGRVETILDKKLFKVERNC